MRPSHCLVLLVLLTGVVAMADTAAPSFQEVEESLTCQCGCGLTVHSCNHLGCGSALPLRAELREQITLGKDKTAILAHFAETYGEKILSSPTTVGFNLTAWIMPFALVSLGAIFVVFTLVRWRGHGAARAAAELADVSTQTPSAYEQILDRELKEFDR